MGKGKKKETFNLKEKSLRSWSVNCSVTARNLRKSDLGGVIFGCKHSTIKECLLKQLFGLPAPHFSYVRNVDPGLPLFLFNYSDRRLHGIFEATCTGKMNINPYGWSLDGSDTLYAAQVRIKTRMQCQSLPEDQFRPIIEDNYYEPQHFWFELDREQTEKLISLFSHSPVIARTNPSYNSSWKDGDSSKTLKGQMPEASKNNSAAEKDHGAVVHRNTSCGLSYSSVVRNVRAPDVYSDPSNMGWGSLDDAHGLDSVSKLVEATTINAVENYEVPQDHVSHVRTYSSVVCSDQSNMGGSSWDDPPNLGRERQLLEATVSENIVENSELVHKEENHETNYNSVGHFYQSKMRGGSWDDLAGWVSESPLLEDIIKDEVESHKEVMHEQECDGEIQPSETHMVQEAEGKHYKTQDFRTATAVVNSLGMDKINEWSSSCSAPHLSGLRPTSEALPRNSENATDICAYEHGIHQDGCVDYKPSGESTAASEITSEDNPREYTEMQPSYLPTIVAKLVEEVKDLKSTQLKHYQKINLLEQELVYSRLELHKLKNCCKTLGLTSNLDESVFIVGGCDGPSWLSTLDAYSPSSDSVISLCPMSSVRKYAAAAKLNGELFVFGGVCDDFWYNSVESYNPTTNRWTCCPSLSRGKGSLAGITSNDKIFAVGGGDGTQSLSEVEIFDLAVGRWIPTKSMQHERFAPAAAEINGILYVAGGYDGKEYLKSVERFDPRECSWTRLESMTSKRGCHSLIVLNEKLYALGGYDGTAMVPTVEVFDPRLGSWMMGELMNDARGYFGAFVMGDTIYVMGGLNKNDEILDVVESFREGHSWQVTTLKGVGKRGFFSAVA